MRKWKNYTRKERRGKRTKERLGGGGERGAYMVCDFYIPSMKEISRWVMKDKRGSQWGSGFYG